MAKGMTIAGIFPSINFSSEFSRIHVKETQELFDPNRAQCFKLVQQRGKAQSLTCQALRFLRDFQQKIPVKNDAPATETTPSITVST